MRRMGAKAAGPEPAWGECSWEAVGAADPTRGDSAAARDSRRSAAAGSAAREGGEGTAPGGAVMQVAHAGSEAQVARAKQVLTDTRKALYRILADEEPETSS